MMDLENKRTKKTELGLNAEQTARVDEINRAALELCRVLTEDKNLELDAEEIMSIANYAALGLNIKGRRVRYPAVVEWKDGSRRIEEYFDFSRTLRGLTHIEFQAENGKKKDAGGSD